MDSIDEAVISRASIEGPSIEKRRSVGCMSYFPEKNTRWGSRDSSFRAGGWKRTLNDKSSWLVAGLWKIDQASGRVVCEPKKDRELSRIRIRLRVFGKRFSFS